MEDKKKCSDDFIKEGLKEGEGKNFNESIKCLLNTCFPKIKSWIITKGGNGADAMEVFQESILRFLEILRKREIKFTSTVCNFFWGIASKVWFNDLKRRKRLSSEEPIIPVDPEIERIWEEMEKEKRFESVENRFKELSEICQGILTDFYYNHFSIIEIAEKYGYKSAQVAKQRKFKCLESLRNKM